MPSCVWIMIAHCDISTGESSGACSIFGHLTSCGGGNGPVPFQQSLTQSSYGFAYAPSVSDIIFQSSLKTAKVTSVQEARALSSEELRVANYVQVSGSQWGSFTYGQRIASLTAVASTKYLQPSSLMVPTSPINPSACSSTASSTKMSTSCRAITAMRYNSQPYPVSPHLSLCTKPY